jgi:hypothetical protein
MLPCGLSYECKLHEELVYFNEDLIESSTELEILIPKKCPYDLIRIGGNRDGAYLVPSDLQGIAKCFSPGVNNYKYFEDELSLVFGIQCYMCDYSSDESNFATPLIKGMQFFQKKWLDVDGGRDSISLSEWINGTDAGADEDLMLQIDIEGAEYRNLISAEPGLLKRFRIIVIELHTLSSLQAAESRSSTIARTLRKLIGFSARKSSPVAWHRAKSSGSII